MIFRGAPCGITTRPAPCFLLVVLDGSLPVIFSGFHIQGVTLAVVCYSQREYYP